MYYQSQKLIALLLFIVTLPVYPLLFFAIVLSSKGPFIFKQKRMGMNKKVFIMYKFRTMIDDAEKVKEKYGELNEASTPAFKIRNDPRYTKIGKILAHTAIDELPQLINIVKGDMAFVGPRPLPVKEALLVPHKFRSRFKVRPGLTSPWVIEGGHKLSFEDWMRSDISYVQSKNIWYDVTIVVKTIFLLSKSLLHSND